MVEEIKANLTIDNVTNICWQACDTFRGVIDGSQYKDYILVMLFLKYMSDVWHEHREKYLIQYDGNEERVNRAMQRERFILPEGCSFQTSTPLETQMTLVKKLISLLRKSKMQIDQN